MTIGRVPLVDLRFPGALTLHSRRPPRETNVKSPQVPQEPQISRTLVLINQIATDAYDKFSELVYLLMQLKVNLR